MNIGLSISYNELETFLPMLKATCVLPKHFQLCGLPADLNQEPILLGRKIDSIRSDFPNSCISFHAYKFNLCEKTPQVLSVWEQLARHTLLAARNNNVSFVNFHAGYGMGGSRIRHSEYRDALIPVLQNLISIAASSGIQLHIENLYPRPLRSELSMLGDRVSDFDCFFEKIDNPSFKLCYDYGHGNIDEHGVDILRKFIHRLGSVHAHDNDQQSDIHWPILMQDSGTIDWMYELDFLIKSGFNGPFILEGSIKNQLESLQNLKKAGML